MKRGCQHTPGPWEAVANYSGGYFIEPNVGLVNGDNATSEANACLIQAAPTLLAAAKIAELAFRGCAGCCDAQGRAYAALQAAIEEVEGRAQ